MLSLFMKTIHILLVEDNEGDIVLTREAFAEANIASNLDVVRNGEEAINYLEKSKVSNEYPDLVLLDINLPKVNGIEVLSHIKQDKELKKIPVVMLSTSSFANDILNSYDNCANCYITKPADLDQFMHVVQSIKDFWIGIVKLPNVN